MKKLLVAALLAGTTGIAAGASFDFQRQVGSTEYVPGYDTAGMRFSHAGRSIGTASLDQLMLSANVDGIAGNEFTGTIEKSGPTRISLYEVMRGSPEATANHGYYTRFPADTDWSRIALEYREGARDKGLAERTRAEHDNT
jgi:hypothetical protein